MNSFIGWVGGKRLLRKEIVSRFPLEVSKKYIEVFGGAGWVFFCKEQHKNQEEIFNDFDGELINLYRCIKYHPEELIKELNFFPHARELFLDFKSQMNSSGLTDIQRAARYFYIIKKSFGSKKGSFATAFKGIKPMLERFAEIQELEFVPDENKSKRKATKR